MTDLPSLGEVAALGQLGRVGRSIEPDGFEHLVQPTTIPAGMSTTIQTTRAA